MTDQVVDYTRVQKATMSRLHVLTGLPARLQSVYACMDDKNGAMVMPTLMHMFSSISGMCDFCCVSTLHAESTYADVLAQAAMSGPTALSYSAIVTAAHVEGELETVDEVYREGVLKGALNHWVEMQGNVPKVRLCCHLCHRPCLMPVCLDTNVLCCSCTALCLSYTHTG